MDVVKDFKFILDRDAVFKCMDCSKDSDAYEEMCDIYKALREEMKKLVQPVGAFRFDRISEKYMVHDTRDCTHVVFCLLTLGSRISERTEYYFANDQYMEGMLFDAMAVNLLEEYTRQFYKNICKEAKKNTLGLTCRISPGNADFPIERQKDILEEVDGSRLMNVYVTKEYMLNPVKSVSFIFGADAKLDIPPLDHECSRCTSVGCKMRKEPYIDKKYETFYNITVLSDKKKINIRAPKSKSIMETLKQNNIYISSPCGGNGTCGKCRVRIISGRVNKLSGNAVLGEELLSEGWCLSCSSYPEEDCVISTDNNEDAYDILQAYDKSDMELDTYYNVIDFYMQDKNLNGKSLTDTINSKLDYEYKYSFKALKKLQGVLTPEEQQEDNHLRLIEKEGTILDICGTDNCSIYGIAIDIGTTTIALSLLNLFTGEIITNYSLLNSQRNYGADVITRIQNSNEGKLKLLNECIKDDLLKGIEHMLKDTGIKPDKIQHIAIAGNTTMIYFLLGISCRSLALFPFNTLTTSLLEYSYHEIFNNDYLDCQVTFLPGVSAYVGADIVSGLLKCGYNKINKTCLLIDIGTNGEMAIGNKNKILCLATAAGPAFEGANITCGTGSINGAISQVEMKNGNIIYKTIGGGAAKGICGSAVIDIAAMCLKNDIIDETGRFAEENYSGGFIKISEGLENQDIIFNQKDIREVQLAKSAIRSGIEILIKEFNVSYKDIDTVFLAGGFGYHMNVEYAAYIGLIPEYIKNKVKCIGNSSLGGAVKYLLNKESKKELSDILYKTSYIDIASNSRFNDLFIDNMLF